MKIWLFGDSFATLKYPTNSHNTQSWVEKLNKSFDLYVDATSGNGASNIMDGISKIDLKKVKDDCLIVFYADPCRVNFENILYKDAQPSLGKVIYEWYINGEDVEEKIDSDLWDWDKNYFKDYPHKIQEIIYHYDMWHRDIGNRSLALWHLCSLLHISYFFKKTIIWPCVNLSFYNINTELLITNEKTSLIDMNICDISQNEIKDSTFIPSIDLRKNHLSQVNHLIMYDLLINYLLEKSESVEVNLFEKNIITKDSFPKKTNNNQFIYE